MIRFNPKLYCYKYEGVTECNLFVLKKSSKLFWEYVYIQRVKKLFGNIYWVGEKKLSQGNWFLTLDAMNNLTPLEKIDLEIEALERVIHDVIKMTKWEDSPVVTSRRQEVVFLRKRRESLINQAS